MKIISKRTKSKSWPSLQRLDDSYEAESSSDNSDGVIQKSKPVKEEQTSSNEMTKPKNPLGEHSKRLVPPQRLVEHIHERSSIVKEQDAIVQNSFVSQTVDVVDIASSGEAKIHTGTFFFELFSNVCCELFSSKLNFKHRESISLAVHHNHRKY